MAYYLVVANRLKSQVEAMHFTAEQLNLIHQMMGACSQLRQRKVIDNFLSAMLPEEFEMKEGGIVHGKFGDYRPMFIVKKGENVPDDMPSQEDEE
jgi:hypothetical protein